MENRWLTPAIIGVLSIGAAVCLWIVASRELTSTEALLLSIVLTAFSTLASWIASRHYAEYSFDKNLRLFALKAAEKVTNLSNELDRLSVFLQQELKATDYDSPTVALLARNLRIEGAIHVINTLKSANDKSLSDWQGVIGEEITAQREEQEEREETLRELVTRLEWLENTDREDASTEEDTDTSALRSDFDQLKNDVRLLASQITGVPLKRAVGSRSKLLVEKECLACGQPLRYEQKPRDNSYKAIACPHCKTELYSQYMNDGFTLKLRSFVLEEIVCPTCEENMTLSLDPMPGTALEIQCGSCGSRLRVFRTPINVGVKEITISNITFVPSEEFLEQVRTLMPEQPWPKGAAREVANKLNVPYHQVTKAVSELINRDAFKLQVNGRLYVKDDTNIE
ncbi:MAG TPA: hypothetical protein VJ183_03290 [Chloroflexia bacterium]|nr:hypothetical protein [Chloroflexia bacterium]